MNANIECRLVTEHDLERMMEWRMRPDITKNMRTHPVLTMEKQKVWLEKINREKCQYHWMIWVGEVPIGVINIQEIDWRERSCATGIYIAEKGGSPGLFFELHWNLFDLLFERLGFKEVHAEALVFNKTAVMLNKRMWPVVDKRDDCYVYHMTNVQWLKMKQGKHYQKIIYEWQDDCQPSVN